MKCLVPSYQPFLRYPVIDERHEHVADHGQTQIPPNERRHCGPLPSVAASSSSSSGSASGFIVFDPLATIVTEVWSVQHLDADRCAASRALAVVEPGLRL